MIALTSSEIRRPFTILVIEPATAWPAPSPGHGGGAAANTAPAPAITGVR
jgi:hypothetical protein